ncbi:penicillin-binding protein activator LpoB [Sansalvadorimonas sp. 2012CJ34-2]|uniref:Penicillin-binding protein activator LpoB n=1 Tax=Parendozoicomonas callyspongiae TaxID=2942213 RepID=A0ABT0PIW3_9GAMM|nr:penicillin-binding protein activator LpoB [Sansalvadorimonas sp. 2012CJ34-2]MCL6271268.1 penicillin-binding protein activator LpoB [Sansalvadorimonas sp. 2012CJ34-2]
MIKKFIKPAVVACVMTLMAGCATQTTYVDPAQDKTVVMGLDYKDFNSAAKQAVTGIAKSPLMVHPQMAQGARYVISVSPIVNDTTQRIDTDQLTKKMRSELLKTGRFITTTAVTANGPEDAMTEKVRKLSSSKLINQATVKKNGTVIAPDFNLTGKIIQRNNKVDRNTQQVDYYFQLTLTNLEKGLAYYEDSIQIIKRGSNKSVSW